MARAYRAMKRHIDREWQQRASNLPYRTPYEALVMASIVEKGNRTCGGPTDDCLSSSIACASTCSCRPILL